jgi:hypothetical protein
MTRRTVPILGGENGIREKRVREGRAEEEREGRVEERIIPESCNIHVYSWKRDFGFDLILWCKIINKRRRKRGHRGEKKKRMRSE